MTPAHTTAESMSKSVIRAFYCAGPSTSLRRHQICRCPRHHRIDRDEIIEILEEALHRLPDELRQARWMMKERDEFIARTRREADEVIEAAKVQAERFVQRAEVVRAAEQRARQIAETAEDDARRVKNEMEDFLDQRLASFEILLDKLVKTVATGRRRLAIGERQEVGSLSLNDESVVESYSDDSGAIFFDQDNTSGR